MQHGMPIMEDPKLEGCPEESSRKGKDIKRSNPKFQIVETEIEWSQMRSGKLRTFNKAGILME